MIENESGYDTTKVAPYPPVAGSHPSPYKSYGLFQVKQPITLKTLKDFVCFYLLVLVQMK